MGEISWIKLSTRFFEDRKIKQIRAMPEGDALLLIWINLLLLAGDVNDGGLVYLTDGVPYTEQTLSEELRRPPLTVRLAIQTFTELHMIEQTADGILISNWEKHQNIDGMERVREKARDRMRRFREREKDLERLSDGTPICSYCGAAATGVDHIVATKRGGPNTDDNKTPCCVDCNRIKSVQNVVDFLNNNRDRINDKLIAQNEKLRRFAVLDPATGKYVAPM